MIADKRQIFFDHFPGLYGVDEVEITNADTDKIYGIVYYLDDDEKQNFCWNVTKQNNPSDDLVQLINVIKDNKLNRTDKIIVTDTKFIKSGWTNITKFNFTVDKLFDIEAKMIDEGEETDSYLIID